MKQNSTRKALFIALAIVVVLLPPVFRIARTPFFDLRMIIRLSALVGFTLMSLQFILSARIPLLEKTFGQDRLMLAHRTAGIASVVILFAHGPVYLIDRILVDGGLFLNLPAELPVVSGSVGFILLVALGIGAAFRIALKIPYDLWKTMHRLTYFIYPMLFLHAMLLGGTIRASRPVYIQFLVMFALVLIGWVWRLSLGIRARKQPYMLSSVRKLNHNVHEFSFAGPVLDHRPGQFAYLTFVKDGKRLPAHPFTISSSPVQDDLTFTIKESGDFTSEIPALPPGTEAHIEGPYGRFSHTNFRDNSSLLFIAGGVGITPMLSMLRILQTDDPDRQVLLLWGNRRPEDVFLREELASFSSNMKNLRIVHVFSEAGDDVTDGFGEHSYGFIDGRTITEYIDDYETWDVFLCGPPVMMNKVRPELRNVGFAPGRIHMERFSL
jgi:predicted ferric reductase